jgi:hypothetical protein
MVFPDRSALFDRSLRGLNSTLNDRAPPIRETTAKGTARRVTVRVPAKIKITIADCSDWVYKNMLIAISMITPNACSSNGASRAVPLDEETDIHV